MASATSVTVLFITRPRSAAPPWTGTQCWVMSTSVLFWRVGRGTCCITSWLNKEGKLNAMNLLIIKNSNSQERSSPLVAVSSGYKTLEDAPVAGWVLHPSPELSDYSCLGYSGIYKVLGEPHCSPVVDKDHPGLLPYTALWQSWGQGGQTGWWGSPTTASQPHFLSCVKGTLDNRLSWLHCSMQPLNLAASTLQCWGAAMTFPPTTGTAGVRVTGS